MFLTYFIDYGYGASLVHICQRATPIKKRKHDFNVAARIRFLSNGGELLMTFSAPKPVGFDLFIISSKCNVFVKTLPSKSN